MFSRKVCYFFVRPKTKYLELCVMLGRPLKAPQVRSVMRGSRSKYANMIRITHRDEVEAPITDWLREAYDAHDALLQGTRKNTRRKDTRRTTKTTKTKKRARRAR